MNNNDFRKMLLLMLLSVAILVATTFMLHLPPLVALPLAIGPLCFYHIRVLLPRARDGLTTTTIDSVYYFGFLVTVAALSVSALLVGFRGAAQSMDAVVLHFGTGLFATAYAVVARLHLQSRVSQVSEVSLEEVMDKYVIKSSELVKNVEAASVRLTSFSREIVSKTIEAAELTRLAANEKMLNVAEEFSTQMSETLESARQGVHEFRIVLNSTAFANERKQYTDSLKETVMATSSLNKALAELISKTREEVTLSKQNISATTDLTLRLSELASQVGTFGAPEGVMAQSTAALQGATDIVTRATGAIAGTVSELEKILVNVDDSSAALKTIGTLSKRTADHLDALNQSSKRAAEAATHLGDLGDSTKVLVRRVKALDTVVETLSGTTGALAANLGRAEVASNSFDLRLARFPTQADAVEAFGARVEKSLEAIAVRTEQTRDSSEVLAGHSENARAAMERVSKLVDRAATLETSVISFQSLLGDLAASVAGAQSTMIDAAAAVKTKLAAPVHVRNGETLRAVSMPTQPPVPMDDGMGAPESQVQADRLPDTEVKA